MRSGLGVCVVVLVAVTAGWSLSQDKPRTAARKPMPKKPIANTQSLDTKVSQAEAAFVRETEGLAGQYFDAGHYEEAETLLKKIEAIEPNRPGVRDKLKIIADTQLSANEVEVEVDASGGWQPAKIGVVKDEPIRIDVEGTYRFVVNTMLGPDGFANDNPDTTMVQGARCGALVGVIVSDGQGGRKNRSTFSIGPGQESFSPPATGTLFLRVNAPPEAKNIGKLKVTLSGSLKAL